MNLFLFVFLLITVVTNAQIKNTKGKPNIIFILAFGLWRYWLLWSTKNKHTQY
jgi:NhaP-type Na+/H+ or K+/H+ antiporter